MLHEWRSVCPHEALLVRLDVIPRKSIYFVSPSERLHWVSTDSRPSGVAVDGLSTLEANALSAAGLVMVPLSVCNVQHSSVQNARQNPFTEWVPDTCQGSLPIMNAK